MTWKNESARHAMASRGIRTKITHTKKYQRELGEIKLDEYDHVPDSPEWEKTVKESGDIILAKTTKKDSKTYWIVYTGYDHTIFYLEKHALPYYNKMVKKEK